MAEMLSITGLETFYGKIQALRGVDLHINKGEIVTLIGANGAGKSTLLMSICGRVQARSGAIVLEGLDITKAPTHEIIQMGVSQSPEGRRIFPRMTVLENLQLGATTNQMAYFEEDVAKVFDLFPRLNERKNQRGGTLSGGEQQMLAIGRALMSRPKLLLMDEPSLGIAPILVRQIFQAIGRISKEEHVTIFLVEQNAFHALKLADRGYVMVNGAISMTGTGSELLARPAVGQLIWKVEHTNGCWLDRFLDLYCLDCRRGRFPNGTSHRSYLASHLAVCFLWNFTRIC